MVKKRVRSLAGFQPVRYSCCINNCVCFIGLYEDLTECPNCKETRFKANGRPRKYFDYIPVIPRLQAMSANSIHAKKMRYQANHVHDPEAIKDVFDGSHYHLYSTPLFLVVKTIPFSTFPMNVTLPLAFRPTVLLHLRSTIRRVGQSFFSTTISLLKYASKRNIAFTLPRSQAPKSLGIWTLFAGHFFKN